MKEKSCKICKTRFKPLKPLQIICSIQCANEYAKRSQIKREAQKKADWNKEKKLRKEKLMSKTDWEQLLQKVFNTYIRKRDEGKPCISCGTIANVQYDAGHYRSVGAHPELRFNELNVHRQCRKCNSYWGGNLIDYRINLVKLIGIEKVEWLESKHEPLKLSIPEIQELIKVYKEKVKKIS